MAEADHRQADQRVGTERPPFGVPVVASRRAEPIADLLRQLARRAGPTLHCSMILTMPSAVLKFYPTVKYPGLDPLPTAAKQ